MTRQPYSIGRRLSWWLAALMLAGLGAVSALIYSATAMRVHAVQQETLSQKARVLTEFIRQACVDGEEELLHKLTLFEPARAGTRLELARGDGAVLFRDQQSQPFVRQISTRIDVEAPRIAGGSVRGRLDVDITHDERLLGGLAVTLVTATLLGAAFTGAAIRWLVRRELVPLRTLVQQTEAISASRLDHRLQLPRPIAEIEPWITQFNALMDRLERAYAQLEGFNADVAHEMRTPLATLIGETELALTRERPVAELRETLASNLEEMQRLAALVNDMLFLSHADRGAVARRGAPLSLSALASQVAEFHEAALEDAGLALRIEGDASVAVDEPLVKRALSNLLGNAVRFADRGSTVTLRIAADAPQQVGVTVHNAGVAIAEDDLPRLFDRFFRADASRCCDDEQHHGLGLAIVSAIARMHGGTTRAVSQGGVTSVGFTLATA